MNIDNISDYRLSNNKEKNLWKDCIFIFDSSALLDFYYLPQPKRNEIYSQIFTKLRGRLWIPSQVEYEYLKNRESSIAKPIIEKYKPLRDKLEQLKKSFKNEISNKIESIKNETKKDDKHPFINQDAINIFINDCKDFNEKIEKFNILISLEIEKSETLIKDCEKSDDVLDNLTLNFKVGNKFSFQQVLEIVQEGKLRYEYDIPPGYGDLKSGEKQGTQIFGDLIIWKEILNYSREILKPIIFITNDLSKSNDWCYPEENNKDRIKSPREELVKEIRDFSNVDFWMYSLPQFLFNANKYINSKIDKEVIDNSATSLQLKNEYKKEGLLKIFVDDLGRDYITQEINKELIETILIKLTPREADFIRLNSPHIMQKALTVEEIAEVFDLTIERALEIRNKAIKKILINNTDY